MSLKHVEEIACWGCCRGFLNRRLAKNRAINSGNAATTQNINGASNGTFNPQTTETETTSNAMEMGPVHVTPTAPIYAVVRQTRPSDQSEASAPAEGGFQRARVMSLYPDTTLIENELYG